MANIQVLVVDDEWNMRNLLRIYLMKEGFEVKEASSGYEALSMMKQQTFDLLILDVMMPGMDGWQVCKTIRETETMPILMLTARSETKDKVHGLGIGADDYLTKPFEPEELLARVFSLLRRSMINQAQKLQETLIVFQHLKIHADAREVHIHEVSIDFTPKEFDLLLYLAQNSQRAFTREELVERLWGYEYTGDARVVDTHIKNIREKLQRARLGYDPIQTVWGVGYKFSAQGGEG
ncbi:response regulator transcription factor [Brevibacillus laterosporus]|uniref:response regulator transcription factor n=1 Tax=Brevibacillus laterosporus TaxID=1465 RepID=UPI000E6B709E|nr:response regulator transcription factor [Brevibacillus laterosporus]AYB38164.1 DNA-binding response regulator [Brevibacillus laterosporus]MBM7111539.1 Transcriptional regulatory protein SrrA [Brevibacillus laterosporus]NKQ22477.1 response regulator transcription factor [Brevibacillus laterosporus]WNX29186.1 response regulator transcription factor [Brevibacillus laterosporus]